MCACVNVYHWANASHVRRWGRHHDGHERRSRNALNAGQSRDVYSRGIQPNVFIYCSVQHTMHPYDENVIDVHIVHLSHHVTMTDRDAL